MKKIVYFSLLVLVWLVVLFPQDVIWSHIKQDIVKNNIQIDAKNTKIQLYILYNKIDITSLTLFDSVHVDRLKISYTLLNPIKIKLNGVLENKQLKGEVNLLDKSGFVLLEKGKYKNTLLRSYFKKEAEGLKYEFTY